MKLKAISVMQRAAAGIRMICGAYWRERKPSEHMAPQDGVGGFTPKPR